jgi:hypothetical protein
MVNLCAKKFVSGTLLIRGNLTLLLQLNKSRSVYRWNGTDMEGSSSDLFQGTSAYYISSCQEK